MLYMYSLRFKPITFCSTERDRLTSQCCRPARGHMVELKSFLAPPLKSYSPCHLPLEIIKENIIIVSTFGPMPAQHCMLSCCHFYLLRLQLSMKIWHPCRNILILTDYLRYSGIQLWLYHICITLV